MDEAGFIRHALQSLGIDPQLAHHASEGRGLRRALSFVRYVAPHAELPNPCHVLTIAYLVEPLTGMRWRICELEGYPSAAKVPALMDLWCHRLPGWSPMEAYRAFHRVQPFGKETALVGLVVYQWVARTWNWPAMPCPDART